MGGITIIDVKIVATCSKHRTKGEEPAKNKHGRVYEDDELSCISCCFDVEEKHE